MLVDKPGATCNEKVDVLDKKRLGNPSYQEQRTSTKCAGQSLLGDDDVAVGRAKAAPADHAAVDQGHTAGLRVDHAGLPDTSVRVHILPPLNHGGPFRNARHEAPTCA